jgi:hypothetical protein
VWRQLWQGRLPAATTAMQGELNGGAAATTQDRQLVARRLAPLYQPQCGSVVAPG